MKLFLLKIDHLWDDTPEIVGVYTKEGVEQAKEIILRNRCADYKDHFIVDSYTLDEMPWDREKEEAKRAAEWIENPVLVG